MHIFLFLIFTYNGHLSVLVSVPTDCQALLAAGETTSDVYQIQPLGSSQPFNVFCEQGLDGGGWAVSCLTFLLVKNKIHEDLFKSNVCC